MGIHLDIPGPPPTTANSSEGMPVPPDAIKPSDLCSSQYPASHEEMMRSPCAPAAVAANISSLVRVGGWDVLIALLIPRFAPRQHLINTSGRQEEKAYGGELQFSLHSYRFHRQGNWALWRRPALCGPLYLPNSHTTGYKFSPKWEHAIGASADVFLQVRPEKGGGCLSCTPHPAFRVWEQQSRDPALWF